MNGDGLVDAADLNCFVQRLITGATTCPRGPCADMNNDGQVNTGDVPLMAARLVNQASPCP